MLSLQIHRSHLLFQLVSFENHYAIKHNFRTLHYQCDFLVDVRTLSRPLFHWVD